MLFNKKDFDSKQRFSIRKLSVGVCSVLLSTLFLTFNEGQTVHASTDVNAADTTTTSVSSNTTNNSSDNNTDKKDDSKVEASSLATAEKHAPIPIAAEIKSNKSEDQTNSASAETATQVSKSKQAQSQTTINIVKATATQASTSSKDSSDTTSSKDNSAQNTVEKNRSTSTSKYTPVLTSETSVSTKTNQSNSNSATQEKSNIKPVTPHADSTEHIAPETYTMDSDTPAYVVAGSDLTNLASKFISNAAALIQSGATFSWVGNAPTATQQDAINGSTISGTIRVTYKDGTSTTKDIESYVEARSQLQPSTFYYVNRVNDTPDFNTADANGNDFSTMIVNQYAYDSTAFSYKILGTLDTSSLGIHWANVQVTDNNTFAGAPLAPTVIGDPYVIKVPYVVQGLKFHMAMPDGYELGNGASIPSQYTLAAFSQTTPVVQVPIHQKMHFYITFHDEDSNTNLGTVEVSGSAAAGTGGYYPSINTKLTFPAGADAGDYYSVSTSGVPDGVQLVGSYGVSLTNPTADWTTPNYQWENTFSVLKALTGATMTINLKHKIQETQEQQTRKPTVNYIKAKVNADGTYTPDGSAFTSAVLDVYYSRTKSKDLVTKKVTYTPWLWDTKQGQNGYHVESGTWTSLPQSWGAVVADVPTLDGYTAATVTDQSGQPANQFVYPTWNKAGTSDEGKESLAYTENAPIYEARPVHTVLYIPNETQTRTVTENYVYADAGDLTGEEVFSPYKLEIFYKKTGSLNVSTNTITYSGWSWDTDAGDSDTPGFHVISGQGNWTGLGSNGQPSGSSLGINVPTKDGYTAIISAYPAAIYSSTVFGNPGVNSGTGYTNDTDSTWYWRNSLTTYYVPNSKLSKTVTRTINITQPGKETETTVQKSTITRTAHLNVNDSGIAYNDWGTDSMYWYALNVPKVGGYTMTVTKTVNGVTTPIQLVNGQIPAETVNGTSQDTTINITWGAVATATLTGTGTSTYNGQAITNAELNNALKVNVTGPTAGAGMYTLQAGDVEFSTDGMNWTTALPINAGNYQVRLTAQGKNGIIAKYGNNSIIWTQNGQSTITSNATYMINKLADNAVMANAQSGNYEMTYNGAAPSTLDPSKFVFTTTVNGQTVTLDATGLNSSDFTWADGNAPVNVGTYKVVLTDAGLAKLNANNPNFDLTNSGNGTFTINQANASATLSGSASREYNGQAVSVDDLNSTSTGNNITLTLHYPKDGNANYSTTVKLNNGYFTWNTPNGQAPVNADSQPYTIVLNSDAIEGIIKQAVGNGQNDVSNVKFADNAISGSASFEITPSANTVSVSVPKPKPTMVHRLMWSTMLTTLTV